MPAAPDPPHYLPSWEAPNHCKTNGFAASEPRNHCKTNCFAASKPPNRCKTNGSEPRTPKSGQDHPKSGQERPKSDTRAARSTPREPQEHSRPPQAGHKAASKPLSNQWFRSLGAPNLCKTIASEPRSSQTHAKPLVSEPRSSQTHVQSMGSEHRSSQTNVNHGFEAQSPQGQVKWVEFFCVRAKDNAPRV